MPAEQRGTTYRTKVGYGIRWCDESGTRRRRSGFKSKTAARKWLETVELPRMRGESVAPRETTFDAFCDDYISEKAAEREKATVLTIKARLKYARDRFGALPMRELETMVPEIRTWITSLPERSTYGILGVTRQVLDAAVRRGYMSQNPARLAREKNSQPKPLEIVPFTHAELGALATELGPWGPLAIVGAETGLRPSELAGLEWSDINDTSLIVARTYVAGELKPYGKTKRARRRVPLTSRAREALNQMPRRIDTPAVFASPRSKRLNVHNFRSREWVPAIESAGIPHRRIYDLRHTFATNALDKGVTLFELSRFMGTSVELIDQTYGHLAEGTETRVLALLETESTERFGHEANRFGH